MTLNQIISDNFEEIITNLNQEILNFRILRLWKKTNPDWNLIELRDHFWTDAKGKKEFATDLGVEFGKMFELFLPIYLHEKGYDCVPSFNSEGDLILEGKSYELKTGQGDDIQGATHSPKEDKPMNLVQVLWEFDKQQSLNTLLETKGFISMMNLCVLDSVKIIRIGKESKNNSRTTYKFPKEMTDIIVENTVFGRCNRGKSYVVFKKTPIVYF